MRRFCDSLELISSTRNEDWKYCWRTHVLEIVAQCEGKALEEDRREVAGDLRRLDSMITVALSENWEQMQERPNTKQLLVPCLLSNDLGSWSSYFAHVGAYHLLDAERSLALLQELQVVCQQHAQGQDAVEFSWLAVATQEVSHMLALLRARLSDRNR